MIRCVKPTKSGVPCKALVQPPNVACAAHADERDKQLARDLSEWAIAQYGNGFQDGRDHPEPCKACQEHAEQQRADRFRLTERGKQIVCCGGGYAYTWDGDEPLAIGDRVLLPGNWLYPGPSQDVVRSLGTDYAGPLQRVLRRVDDAVLAALS